MKKFMTVGMFLLCLFLVWCHSVQNGGPNYKWELTIAWVWPEISFESTVDEWTLVLKWYFEDHSDHIFLPAGTREYKFTEESDYLPWNKVKFEWYVTPLDAAAWNHYYEVINVDKIELINYPNADEVKNLFVWYNYCEKDSDCWYFVWECPLGCYIPLNKKYIDVASSIVTNFVNNLWDERCIYGCLAMNKAVCNNYKCEMIDAPAEADVHGCWPLDKDPELSCDETIYDLVCANDGKTYRNDCLACKEPLVETFTFGQCKNNSGIKYCTAYQKSAENCNMIYQPVCGSDWKTYWNDCVACQSKTVESYTMWECENNLQIKYCTPEKKAADFCTMQYEPVCGSDSRTYGNSCAACQSETVENYTMWECESSAFTVEWDSEYLTEVMNILERDWAVTCDLFYTNYDRQVHSFFMADKNRFYSAIDDYSDNFQRNVIYTLAIDGKIYNWDTFTGSEKLIIDYPADIESEIAGILDDKSKYPDFEIKCYEWIDVSNEHLFTNLYE